MNAVKLLVAAAVIAFIVIKVTAKPDPITFNGVVYEYAESREINKVVNYFFTPGGNDIRQSVRFLQIVDMTDSGIPLEAVAVVKNQMTATMQLKLLEGSDDRYFGMFQGRQPIYAIAKGRKILIYTTVSSAGATRASYQAGAHDLLDKLETVLLGRQ